MKTFNRNDRADFKSGFVTIIGAPNVGKSTLLNRLIGQKISITSKKPQTTRNRILGILHRPDSQIIFIDTPGIHSAEKPLNVRIVESAVSAIGEGDIALILVDAAHPDPQCERIVLKSLLKQPKPAILALNKIDLVRKPALLSQISHWANTYDFIDIVPISATKGDQVETLVKAMESALPEGPAYFPEALVTDQPERFIAAEMIREKIFRATGEEIPYSTAVTIDQFTEASGGVRVKLQATIHVERESQKSIVIGRGGLKLKQIGSAARQDIERMVGGQVFLKLFVRVQKNWTRDTRALRRFGY